MKKGIVVASFGSSFPEVTKKAIESIENDIREVTGSIEVVRAFTSNMIRKKLKDRDNVYVPTCDEAINQLIHKGVDEIFVQPLHIIPGHEYEKVKRSVVLANHKNNVKVTMGKPLLYSEEHYNQVIEAMDLPEEESGNGILLMGHGTDHFANAAYSMLQSKFNQERKDIIIANVEGFPELEHVIDDLNGFAHVTLMPFMIVAGDHAMNDMAGDEEDSFKSILESKGIKTTPILKGLGENHNIREIFSSRVKDWIEG